MMKMKSMLLCAPAIAFALSLCGCGDGAGYKPFAEKGSAFAFAVNLDKQQFFEVADSYIDYASRIGMLPDKIARELKGDCKRFKKNPSAMVPKKFQSFWNDSGLEDARFRWVAISMKDINIANGVPQFDGLSVAIAATVDIDRLVSTINNTCSGVVSLQKTKLEGEKVWHVVPLESSAIGEMKSMGIDPYIASLDGKLLLGGCSKGAISRLIRHYRKGMRTKNSFDGFTADKGQVACLHLDLAAVIKAADGIIPADKFMMLDALVPDGSRIAKDLKSLDIDVDVGRTGRFTSKFVVKAGSAKDAEFLRRLVMTRLMFARTRFLQMGTGFGNGMSRELETIKIEGTGDSVEVKDVDIAFVAMVELMPTISRAIKKARERAANAQSRAYEGGMPTQGR